MARLRMLGDPRAVLFACLFASQSALLVLSPTLIEVARDLHVSTATAGQLRSISGATGASPRSFISPRSSARARP